MELIDKMNNDEKYVLMMKLMEDLKLDLEENCVKLGITTEQLKDEDCKRSILCDYIVFDNDEVQETFYNKIKSNKQTLKKIYDKCYKLHKNLQKRKLDNERLKTLHIDKEYNIDIKLYDCNSAEYVKYNKFVKQYKECRKFDDYWEYSKNLQNFIKFPTQQSKSKWKLKLKNMDDNEVEKQLFYLSLQFDNETYELMCDNYKMQEIHDYEQRDPCYD
tara:strand:- start:2203 stop:2853 length:651 start_codon:yes stop_codon:yes gene_type:complete